MGSHVYNVVKAPIGWSLVCHRERIGGYVSSQAALEAATAQRLSGRATAFSA